MKKVVFAVGISFGLFMTACGTSSKPTPNASQKSYQQQGYSANRGAVSKDYSQPLQHQSQNHMP
jgi:hypothetical protein